MWAKEDRNRRRVTTNGYWYQTGNRPSQKTSIPEGTVSQGTSKSGPPGTSHQKFRFSLWWGLKTPTLPRTRKPVRVDQNHILPNPYPSSTDLDTTRGKSSDHFGCLRYEYTHIYYLRNCKKLIPQGNPKKNFFSCIKVHKIVNK